MPGHNLVTTVIANQTSTNRRLKLRLMLSTLSLMTVCACTIAREFSAPPVLASIAGCALLLFVLLEWGKTSSTCRFFALMAPTLVLVLWQFDRLDASALLTGLDRAAYFTLFLTSLAVLRESAGTSALVKQCGRILVNQPPGRRYLMMSFGSHLFSLMLSIGSLNILGSMARNAVHPYMDAEQQRIGNIRNKRMLLAVLRGFSSIQLWAPTSVTMLLVISGIPGLEWESYAPIGIICAVSFILLGAVWDYITYPRVKTGSKGFQGMASLLKLVALVMSIPITAYLFGQLSGLRLFSSLLICTPFVGTLWIWRQYSRKTFAVKAALLARRFGSSFPVTFTSQRNEVLLFASSGFIGSILVPLVDPIAVGSWLSQVQMGPAWLMIGLSLALVTLGFIGINAILTVTLMLGVLQQLPNLNVPPAIQAVVITISWATFAGSSPFTASVRIASSFSLASPRQFGVGWNGGFCVSALLILYTVLLFIL